MSLSKDRPRRPSYPSPPCHSRLSSLTEIAACDSGYLDGISDGHACLCRAQAALREQATLSIAPRYLWKKANQALLARTSAYRDGFLDVLTLFVQLSLEGCHVEPDGWRPVDVLLAGGVTSCAGR